MSEAKEKITAGGQAVIEGVMMRTPHAMVIAVRRPSGEIVVKEQEWESIWTRWNFLRRPFLRGIVVLIETLVNGIQALTFSADEALEESFRPGPLAMWRKTAYHTGRAGAVVLVEALIHGIAALDRTNPDDPYYRMGNGPFGRHLVSLASSLGMNMVAFFAGVLTIASSTIFRSEELNRESSGQEQLTWAQTAGTIALAFILGILFFVALPHYLTAKNLGLEVDTLAFHAVDGLIKVLFLVAYIAAISLMPDIRRVFMYHGAEHKSVFAFEAGKDLTVENVKPYSTLHPRCGTAFLLFVIVVSIIVFALVFPFMPRFTENFLLNNLIYIGIKIPLMLPIAGISYEIIKLAGNKPENRMLRALSMPGLLLQRLTTREPTDDQILVALKALSRALDLEHSRSSQKR